MRRPIRFLFKFAVFFGMVYVLGRFVARKKGEFAGLTESAARDKLIEKMAPKVGDDTAAEIADQVIPKLRSRGLIKPDPIDEASDEIEQAAADAIEEAADKVTDAVDSVVKD